MIDDSEKEGNHAAGVGFFLSCRPGQCPLTIYATQLKSAGQIPPPRTREAMGSALPPRRSLLPESG